MHHILALAQDIAGTASDNHTRTLLRRLADDLGFLNKQLIAHIKIRDIGHRTVACKCTDNEGIQQAAARLFIQRLKQLLAHSGALCRQINDLRIIKRNPQLLGKHLTDEVSAAAELTFNGINCRLRQSVSRPF